MSKEERFEMFGDKLVKDNEQIPNLLDNYLCCVRLNEFADKVADLEAKLANKNNKCEALYSVLYTILEEQDPENVASQIEQITKQNFDKENETFKENRNVIQLLKIVQDQKQQLAITEKALELACETIKQMCGKPLWIGGNIPSPEPKDGKYFKDIAKEMLENE